MSHMKQQKENDPLITLQNKLNQTISFKVYSPLKSSGLKQSTMVQSIDLNKQSLQLNNNESFELHQDNMEQKIDVISEFMEYINKIKKSSALQKIKVEITNNKYYYRSKKDRIQQHYTTRSRNVSCTINFPTFNYYSLKEKIDEVEQQLEVESRDIQIIYKDIQEKVDNFEALLEQVRLDIESHRFNIIENLEWETFTQIIENYNQQINETFKYNESLFFLPVEVSSVQDLTQLQQYQLNELSQNILNNVKHRQRQSNLNTLEVKDKPCLGIEKLENKFIIYPKRLFQDVSLSNEENEEDQNQNDSVKQVFFFTGSDIQDSCDIDFYNEMHSTK